MIYIVLAEYDPSIFFIVSIITGVHVYISYSFITLSSSFVTNLAVCFY